jgi:nucleotide-binding universal stress UspA family protein
VPFRTILIATDFSEHSDAAARCGMRVASAFQSDVLFLHVFDISQLPIINAYPYYYGAVNQELIDDMRQRANAALAEFVKKHVGDAAVERKMVAGKPAQQILEIAAQRRVDLIVMGTTGMGRVRELLGSVVHAVVRESRVPVLTVREYDDK